MTNLLISISSFLMDTYQKNVSLICKISYLGTQYSSLAQFFLHYYLSNKEEVWKVIKRENKNRSETYKCLSKLLMARKLEAIYKQHLLIMQFLNILMWNVVFLNVKSFLLLTPTGQWRVHLAFSKAVNGVSWLNMPLESHSLCAGSWLGFWPPSSWSPILYQGF